MSSIDTIFEKIDTSASDARRFVEEHLEVIAYTVIALIAALFVVMWWKSRND